MKKPIYKTLYLKFKQLIEAGNYSAGDLLPSENQLCLDFNTTRATVRKAMTELEHEGLIKKQHGKGSIVQVVKKGIGILSLEGTSSNFAPEEMYTKIIHAPVQQQWPLDFWYPLSEQEQKAGCITFERIREIKGKPLLLEVTYLPNLYLGGFMEINLENKSLFQILLHQFNIKPMSGDQKIRAITADQALADKLKIEKDFPTLHLERKIETNKIGFNIYSSIHCLTVDYFLQGRF
ncbi:GntR family transcriptional regulator [Persicobacter diffluens]|uniref:GntR family transcriptional regulator n=1 Tax=Persicobacter diffluens TaxID=981 RepID=A0AAN4W381_9BACT|nr:GntR family transcriptional regulator [Persicobacter diffluens]